MSSVLSVLLERNLFGGGKVFSLTDKREGGKIRSLSSRGEQKKRISCDCLFNHEQVASLENLGGVLKLFKVRRDVLHRCVERGERDAMRS